MLFLLLVAMLATLPQTTANVVVFDRYQTTASIESDMIHIERDVRIRNVGKSPIIPGELHFRLFERRGDEKVPIPVTNFKASSGRGEALGTKIQEKQSETDLSIHLWNPLLPGFSYEFTMEYDMAFDPNGILFYEINLPKEDTTIPITNEQTSFVLDNGYHVTYAPGSEVGSLSGNTVVSWQGEDNRVVEYSRIPLPRIGIRAVNVFWVIIILLLAAFFALNVFRRIGGSKRGGGGHGPAQQQWQQPQQQWQQPPGGGWG